MHPSGYPGVHFTDVSVRNVPDCPEMGVSRAVSADTSVSRFLAERCGEDFTDTSVREISAGMEMSRRNRGDR